MTTINLINNDNITAASNEHEAPPTYLGRIHFMIILLTPFVLSLIHI